MPLSLLHVGMQARSFGRCAAVSGVRHRSVFPLHTFPPPSSSREAHSRFTDTFFFLLFFLFLFFCVFLLHDGGHAAAGTNVSIKYGCVMSQFFMEIADTRSGV